MVDQQRAGGTRSIPVSILALLVMAAIGIGISIYLTSVHYAKTPLLCTAGGPVNCQAVTTSSYSVIPGTSVPITIPGMIWFAVVAVLAIAAWQSEKRDDGRLLQVTLAQFIWGTLGLIAILYLIYAEIVKLKAICEWCTGVHILTLLCFLVVVVRLQQLPLGEEFDEAAG